MSLTAPDRHSSSADNLAPDLKDDVDAELEHVLKTRAFASAPVMSRLLRFLVGEMLAGRGKRLKAYTVAVDALGRANDFDPLVDSYPRVQVGRLRKMLEANYARHAVPGQRCLFIRKGGYEVGFARLDRAYPELAAKMPPTPIAPLLKPPPPRSPANDLQPIQLAVTLPKGVWWAIGLAGLGLTTAALALIVYILTGHPIRPS